MYLRPTPRSIARSAATQPEKTAGVIGLNASTQNGAQNLLLRVNDPEYRRYMTKEAVKKLERGRYEAWCKSRQEEPIKEASNKKRLKKAA